jgi:hypothetical protein
LGTAIVFGVVLSAGYNKVIGQSSSNNDEQTVKEAFEAFQAAIKAKDAEKLWGLLDSDSRGDAERAAKAIKAAYAKASAEQKAELEKKLGLAGDELAKLTGAGFLKTKRFLGKYDEVPGSKIEKVTVQRNSAKVQYVEEDGDKETMKLIRQDGKWKLSVPMPQK